MNSNKKESQNLCGENSSVTACFKEIVGWVPEETPGEVLEEVHEKLSVALMHKSDRKKFDDIPGRTP